MGPIRKLFFLFTYTLSLTICFAQDNEQEEEKPFYVDMTIDEDLFLLKSTDQFYSFGTKILLGWEDLDNNITNSILPKLNDSHQLFEFGLVHKMYTPKDIHQSEVDSTDIPYCGETYLTLTHQSINPSNGIIFMTSLDVGVVGKISGAQTFQNGFHGIIGNSSVDGWDNQIGNGLYLNYSAGIMRNFISPVPFVDVYLGSSGTVGTMDISFMGFLYVRFGLFNDYLIQADRPYSTKTDLSPFYNLKDKRYARMKYPNAMWSEDPTLREKATKDWLRKNFRPTQVYFKLLSGGILNLYDGEMQGSLIPFESSPYTIPYDQIPKWQHRLSLGIVLSYHFGTIEYTWDRITYQPDNVFPPYYPKWGRFNINLNL